MESVAAKELWYLLCRYAGFGFIGRR